MKLDRKAEKHVYDKRRLTSSFEWSAEEQATALLTRSSCTAKSVYVLVLSRHSHLTVREGEREKVCVREEIVVKQRIIWKGIMTITIERDINKMKSQHIMHHSTIKYRTLRHNTSHYTAVKYGTH